MGGLKPARVVPPGTVLRREIEERDWTQKVLAEIIGRPPQAISEIIRGEKQITPETALELSAALGTSPEFWMNLETNYRLHLAQKQKDRKEIERKSALYGSVPMSELIKRGWLKAADSIEDLEKEVLSFLKMVSLKDRPALAVNFRHSEAREPEYLAKLAWIRRVEYVAKTQEIGVFETAKLGQAIPALLDLSVDEGNVARIPDILLKLGIHFVIVPHLPKTYVDGAMVPGANPIVALTLRYNRIDNFWFTLSHELAHIIAGHKQVKIDEKGFENDPRDADERQANTLASNWLLSPKLYRRFVRETRPYFSAEAIEGFAASQSRHPSIVLGRLQNDAVLNHSHLRRFHTKVVDYLADWIDKPMPDTA